MAFTRAWRNFKRAEDCAFLAGALVYAAAVLDAWRELHVDASIKLLFGLAVPSVFLGLAAVAPLLIAPLRLFLTQHVWRSFTSGFGQTPVSILGGLALLALAAGFVFLQIRSAARGGPFPAPAFAAFAAGVGILLVQAFLVRLLERDPKVRPLIEAP